MNESRFIKLCLILLICFFRCGNTTAQNPGTTPDEPVLESVSVDPVTGYVTVTWTPRKTTVSPSPVATDGYYVCWLQKQPSSTNHIFAKITNPATLSYTFDVDTMIARTPTMPDPRKTTVPFTVVAYHNAPYSASLRSDEDYNMQVTNKYDSCRAEIRLNWHPYRGWYPNREPFVLNYDYYVMRIPVGGGPAVEIKRLTDQDTSYIVSKVNENEQYTFYIEARQTGGSLRSTSYKTEKYTAMPIPPSFIQAEGTEYDSQGIAEITFLLDPASQTHGYAFLGSSKPDYSYVKLADLDNITGSQLVLNDIQARGKTYYYKLMAWHVCKDRYTAESNPATALWLYLKQEEQLNTLQWDSYKDWGKPAKYEVRRQIGSNAEEIIATLTDSDGTTYKDDLSGAKIDGEICYRVTAVPESSGSADQYAVSNSICIQPESDIYIPRAFTPNGDGSNDEYRPFFSYPPKEYLFIIYDRNGAKVFQTESEGDAWDGQLKNGKPANEGAYGYYIKFRTAKGRLVEKRGTLILVLP